MPIYDYICNKCGAQVEDTRSIAARKDKKKCDSCKEGDLVLTFSVDGTTVIRVEGSPTVIRRGGKNCE